MNNNNKRMRATLTERHDVVKNPNVINPVKLNKKMARGSFVRVIPKTWGDVYYLRSLEYGYAVFAPWQGDGVFVLASYIPVE